MMARLLAALSLLFLVAAATPDWTRTVRPTPEGGRLVGNPAAPVKLVEFAAYTCPHCAHFSGEASATLSQAIRSGKLAVELRPIVFDQIGLAATMYAQDNNDRYFLSGCQQHRTRPLSGTRSVAGTGGAGRYRRCRGPDPGADRSLFLRPPQPGRHRACDRCRQHDRQQHADLHDRQAEI